MTRSFYHTQQHRAKSHLAAIAHRRKFVFGLRAHAEMYLRTRALAQFQVSCDKIGVEMRKDVTNLQALCPSIFPY